MATGAVFTVMLVWDRQGLRLGLDIRQKLILTLYNGRKFASLGGGSMENKIYAIIGPHGSGKNSICEALMDLGVPYVKTSTNRSPTALDEDCRTVNFLSDTAFLKGDWIVKTHYKGAYYGIDKKEMLLSLRDHRISICKMDLNGVKQVRKMLNTALETIYIMSDYITLVDRMLKMGHTNDEMKYHLEYAEKNGEFETYKHVNYVVKNTSTLQVAINQVLAIMGLMHEAPRNVFKTL